MLSRCYDSQRRPPPAGSRDGLKNNLNDTMWLVKVNLMTFVASNPAVFGVSRMWEILSEMSNNLSHIRVFYDRPSALKWLNLERLPH